MAGATTTGAVRGKAGRGDDVVGEAAGHGAPASAPWPAPRGWRRRVSAATMCPMRRSGSSSSGSSITRRRLSVSSVRGPMNCVAVWVISTCTSRARGCEQPHQLGGLVGGDRARSRRAGPAGRRAGVRCVGPAPASGVRRRVVREAAQPAQQQGRARSRATPGPASPSAAAAAARHDHAPAAAEPPTRRSCVPRARRCRATWPMTMPVWMAATVSRPIGSGGSSSGTGGSCAVPGGATVASQAGQDGATQERAVRVDHVDGRGRAQVHHDDRARRTTPAAQAPSSRSAPRASAARSTGSGMALASATIRGRPGLPAASSVGRRSTTRGTTMRAATWRRARAGHGGGRGAGPARMLCHQSAPAYRRPRRGRALTALLPTSTAMIARRSYAWRGLLPGRGAAHERQCRAEEPRQVLRQQRPGLQSRGHLPPAATAAQADRGLSLSARRPVVAQGTGWVERIVVRPAGRVVVLHAALDLPQRGLLGAPRVRDARRPAAHLHPRPGRRAGRAGVRADGPRHEARAGRGVAGGRPCASSPPRSTSR